MSGAAGHQVNQRTDVPICWVMFGSGARHKTTETELQRGILLRTRISTASMGATECTIDHQILDFESLNHWMQLPNKAGHFAQRWQLSAVFFTIKPHAVIREKLCNELK